MPSFNRYDICLAWYLYAARYHSGQSSKLYQVFGRLSDIRFKGGFGTTEDPLTKNGNENARAIYDSLVERKVYQ